jgi:glycosyltransferase involved in cell wall biosynthesis
MDGAISVVIPAYNRAGLIGDTLRSLFNQTLPGTEIIVVDDGSTDSTAEAAESEFAVFSRQYQLTCGPSRSARLSGKGKLPEFRVIRQKNAGPGAARNRGLAESKGEFIHFFDSDDIAAPNKHEVQVRALQESGADIAYGPWVKGRIVADEPQHGAWSEEQGARSEELGAGSEEHGAGGKERGAWSREQGSEAKKKRYSFEPEGHVLQQKGLPQGDLIKELLTRWSVVPHACMFRRSIVEKIGGFPDDMFVAEDQLVFLRCLLAGARVVHTPQTLAFYRLGDASKLTESAEGHRRRITDWAVFLERSRKECASRGIVPEKWFDFRMRLRSAQRERAALLGLNNISPAAVGDCVFGAVARIRKWWGGLMVRLTGNRQNSSFRCGRLSPAQVALFPTS